MEIKTKSDSSNMDIKSRIDEEKKQEIQASIDKIYKRKRLFDEIIAVLMVAVGIFLIVSVMTDVTGKFGEVLSITLKGLFGLGAYILPFYIIIYALFVLMNHMAHLNVRTVFFFLLIFIDICMLNSARFPAASQTFFDIGSFTDGVNLEGGGVVGMFPAWLLIKFVTMTGLIIIGVLILIISIMFIVKTPVSSFFENRKKNRIRKQMEKQVEAAVILQIAQKEEAGSIFNKDVVASSEAQIADVNTDSTEPVNDAAAETANHSSTENVKIASNSNTIKDVSFLQGYMPNQSAEVPSVEQTEASAVQEPLGSETVQMTSPETSVAEAGEDDESGGES